MKRLILILVFCLTPLVAFSESEEVPASCTSDVDCPEGTSCQQLPMMGMACDPDDEESCPEMIPEYACLPDEGWTEDICTTDADCSEGSICLRTPCPACECAPCTDEEDCPPCDCPPCDESGICVPEHGNEGHGSLVGDLCDTDEQCPMSFTCQEIETSSCGTMVDPPSCVCPSCTPGEECPPCDCDDEPTPDDGGSTPAMPGADEEDGREKEGREEDCVPETEQRCVFTPIDCLEDADVCGDGFYCAPIESCSVSGWSGGTGCVCADCPEGEECPPCECDEDPVPPSGEEEICETEAAICAPEEIECAENSDCPEDWECAGIPQWNETTMCTCAPCDCPDCEGDDCEPCECPPCECDDIDPEPEILSLCLPEGWLDILGPVLSDGLDVDEALIRSEQGSNGNGGPDTRPVDPAGGTENAAKSSGGGGCTAAPTSGPLTGALFVLLLLVGSLRLRRREEAV